MSGLSQLMVSSLPPPQETQACAMSLVLATGTNQQVLRHTTTLHHCPPYTDSLHELHRKISFSPLQVAGWAAKAFFKYGGEPHFVFPTTLGPASQPAGSPAHLLTTPTNMGQTPQVRKLRRHHYIICVMFVHAQRHLTQAEFAFQRFVFISDTVSL